MIYPGSGSNLHVTLAGYRYVWFHFHPAGSVYLPYTGKICFQTATNDCVVSTQTILSQDRFG